MGVFLEALEMKTKATIPSLQHMELEALDDLFVIPAERLLEQACNLDLNTEGHPRLWHGRLTSGQNASRWLNDYLNDYRRATILTVNAMASQPQGIGQRTVRGASDSYSGRVIPPAAKAMMARWSAPRRLYRV